MGTGAGGRKHNLRHRHHRERNVCSKRCPLSIGHASSSILNRIEFDDVNSTEIHVVNPRSIRANLTINLVQPPRERRAGEYAAGARSKERAGEPESRGLFPSIQRRLPLCGRLRRWRHYRSALLYTTESLGGRCQRHPVNPQASAVHVMERSSAPWTF